MIKHLIMATLADLEWSQSIIKTSTANLLAGATKMCLARLCFRLLVLKCLMQVGSPLLLSLKENVTLKVMQ